MIFRSCFGATYRMFRRCFHYAAFLVLFLAAAVVGAQTGPPLFDITVKRL